jgi:diguanylate cyclase (GGDEF)-like protein/PAS domain S-box-containing protein
MASGNSLGKRIGKHGPGSGSARPSVVSSDLDWLPSPKKSRRKGNTEVKSGSGGEEPRFPILEAFDSAQVALILADEAGAVRFWNKGAEKLFGHGRAEVMGRLLTTLLAGDVPKQLKERVRPGSKSGRGETVVDATGRRADGSEFPLQLSLGWLKAKGERLRFVLARDLSEERRSESALRESESLHRRTQGELQDRIRFENLITSLSSNFINLPSERIDMGINYALHTLGEFAGVDRSYIFLFSSDKVTVDNTHEWCAPGIDPQINRLKRLPVARFPWFMEKIHNLQTVYVPRVADLPETAGAEKDEFEKEGIRSLLIVPMVLRGSPKGYLGFDVVRQEKRWADEITGLLRIAGEMFINALERKRSDQALSEAKSNYMNIFENSVEGIYQSTPAGRFLSANPAMARLFGFDDPREMAFKVGDIARELYVDADRRREFLRILGERGRVSEFESQVRRRDGSVIWISENARAVRKADGSIDFCEGTVMDVSQRKRMEEQLIHGALHDSLTGLPNRALFMERLGRALERSRRRPDNIFAAMVLDVDRFKMVNDSMGHSLGDRLLVSFAERLSAFLPPETTLARPGGDEYFLLIEDIRDVGPATALADRILEALAVPFDLDGSEVYAGASIGITVSAGQYRVPEEVLRDADTAMHKAKRAGKGRYEMFDASMHVKAVQLLTLETDMRRALERNEFRIHYQPIVSIEDGSLNGFEALIRWQHPRLGLVPPADFIPLAEDTGLIVPIGSWVLRHACLQLAEWQGIMANGRGLSMSVNISGKQLVDMEFASQVERLLLEAKLEPASLKLEVTESAIMDHPDMSAAILTRLKEIGVRLSLDDFGTGYSSLSYLHRFPFHNLKIDRSFVSKMEAGEKDAEIVRVINSLARNLGMDVVAEGIETKGQWELLQKLSCAYGQGYYFSKPLEGSAARRLIEKGEKGGKGGSAAPVAPAPPAEVA